MEYIPYPGRALGLVTFATWRIISWGGLVVGLAFLTAILMGAGLFVLWRRVEALGSDTQNLTRQMDLLKGTVNEITNPEGERRT